MYRVTCCVRTKCVVSVLDSDLNAVIMSCHPYVSAGHEKVTSVGVVFT